MILKAVSPCGRYTATVGFKVPKGYVGPIRLEFRRNGEGDPSEPIRFRVSPWERKMMDRIVAHLRRVRGGVQARRIARECVMGETTARMLCNRLVDLGELAVVSGGHGKFYRFSHGQEAARQKRARS